MDQLCTNPRCGKTFYRNEKAIGRPKLYCNNACKARHIRDKDKEMILNFQLKLAEEERTNKLRDCKHCGEQFPTRRRDQVFCSTECKSKYHNNKHREEIEQAKKYVNICLYSGERFETNTATARFANKNCSNMFRKQQRLQELVTRDEVFEKDDFAGDSDMVNEIFIDCDFEEVDFVKKDMTRCRFIRCRFTDCDFTWSIFQGVDLIDCEFFGINDFTDSRVALTRFPAEYADCINIKKAFIKTGGMQAFEMKQMFTQKCTKKFIKTIQG